MKEFRKPTSKEFYEENRRGFDRVPLCIFLCGKGNFGNRRSQNLRSFLKSKIESEVHRCKVWLGEHQSLIRAYRSAGGGQGNLADYEYAFAQRSKTDLVIIFPSGPGSFAELGIFCREKEIASKMTIFVNRTFRGNKRFIMAGAVEAARIRRSQIIFVNYRNRKDIWQEMKRIILSERERKRGEELDRLKR